MVLLLEDNQKKGWNKVKKKKITEKKKNRKIEKGQQSDGWNFLFSRAGTGKLCKRKRSHCASDKQEGKKKKRKKGKKENEIGTGGRSQVGGR